LISFFIKNIFLQNELNNKLNFITLFMFIILQIISVFFSYFQNIFFNKISVGIIKKLRQDVMQSTLNQPIDYFDSQPIGKIISKITNDTEVIKELYDTVIPTLSRNVILILII
ncbi:multidrug resistance-like ATP-binding protein MdlB, partial [Buchnera aphidicola]|nr:multidrug resistance-like ATP-binding protein MdlB [Buchnera aphidicola]